MKKLYLFLFLIITADKDYGRGNLSRLKDLNVTNRKIRYKDLVIE